MHLADVFHTLYAAGITLLPVEPDSVDAEGPITDAMRDLIHHHKQDIRDELQRQRIGKYDAYLTYPSPLPRRYVIPASCRTRGACHRLGPCGSPNTARCYAEAVNDGDGHPVPATTETEVRCRSPAHQV